MHFLKTIEWLDLSTDIPMINCDHDRANYIESPALTDQEAIMKFKKVPGLFMGRNTGIPDSCIVNSNTVIGRYCSIAHYCQIGVMGHRMEHLSTGYLDETKANLFTDAIASQYKDLTRIGCDVWLGSNVVVLREVKIGHGAVIGAGAVVTKDIPPYAIAVGNPARVLKYRFSEEIIRDLMELKWWMLPAEIIKKLPYENIEESIEELRRIREGS